LSTDKTSPLVPNKLSLAEVETLDLLDKNGRWWKVNKPDGTTGSTFFYSELACFVSQLKKSNFSTVAPSNFLALLDDIESDL